MNFIAKNLLEKISDLKNLIDIEGSAYNIREDGQCAGRKSTKNIKIESKEDAPGLVVRIAPGTKDEKVYIPACVTHGSVDDLVYNDFYVGEDADVTIVAGCGVHTEDDGQARHNGIHRFILAKNARVLYLEKHIGTGGGKGIKRIDPITDAELAEGAVLTMDTIQLGGVDDTTRTTRAVLGASAKIIVRERIMTDGNEKAKPTSASFWRARIRARISFPDP